MPNEITVGPGGWGGWDAVMADQQARAEAEAARQDGGRARDPFGAADKEGPVGGFLTGLGSFLGDVMQLGEAQSRTASMAPPADGAPAAPAAPTGGWGSRIPGSDPVLDAASFSPVQGPNLPGSVAPPTGGWGTMIPGSAPIMDATAFNPVQGPAFSPLAAAVNQAVAAPAAPAQTGLLGGTGPAASPGGGYSTTGDFSLAASDARMADVGGFHDPLSGGYVDMGGGDMPGLLGGFSDALGSLFGGGNSSDGGGQVGEGTSALW